MELLSQTSDTFKLSAKIFFVSTSVLSAAIMLIFWASAIADFAVYEVPSLYNGAVSWLNPHYLYLVINCIIITIVASSKLQSKKDDVSVAPLPLEARVAVQTRSLSAMLVARSQTDNPAPKYKYDDFGFGDYDVKEEKSLDLEAYTQVDGKENRNGAAVGFNVSAQEDATNNKENEFVIDKSIWNAGNNRVKPPVSAIFSHRKNVKAIPEGEKIVLGVSKAKRQDTITRHLRKSETCLGRDNKHLHRPQKILNKAETFNNRSSSPKPRREPSLTQDELNRRVEAFINKFNEGLRLQR